MKLSKYSVYWIVQFFGWAIYTLLALVQLKLSGEDLTTEIVQTLVAVFLLGIFGTHLYRTIIIKIGWMDLRFKKLISRIIIGAILSGVIFQSIFQCIQFILDPNYKFELDDAAQDTLSWTLLLFIWSALYFTFHFFEKFRTEEIKNLKWEAKKNEIELNKLKSQLNPHFIFNSMNTIKALVEDEPLKAKNNITKLSNILRNTLLMGKKEVIPFNEELNLVKDYLDLEHTRFEERLAIEYNIDASSANFSVPPMMLQTLVENGIKHGISKLPDGGILSISTVLKNRKLEISIFNSGNYVPKKSSSGFGLSNSKQRLQILYGPEATINIENKNNGVLTTIIIPQTS